jgi:lactose/L-arabinose transport system permease protein
MMQRTSFLKAFLKYGFLAVVSFLSLFPFYWMVVSATNASNEVIAGKLTVGAFLIENVKTLAKTVHLGTAFWNSLRNASAGTLASLVVCSLAGYAFQIYRDKGKDNLMNVLLLSMMVPFASTMVPLFRMFSDAHLMNTTLGFILPSVSTAFLIFFFRQNSQSFPLEVIHSARVDGLGELGIFVRIYVPIMAPTFAAAAIVTFMANWNNYLWPLIVMQSQQSQTMPLLISGLIAGYTTNYGILMLAVTICTLPTVVLFFTQQKRFVAGVLGAVK